LETLRQKYENLRSVGIKLRNDSRQKIREIFSGGNPQVVLSSLQYFCRSRKVLPVRSSESQNADVFQLKAIRPKGGYNVDEAFTSKPHTAELFATVRDNGRILDDFRCVVGGHAVFEASFELGKVMEDPSISRWTMHLQKWPRDVNLRAGMLTGFTYLFTWEVVPHGPGRASQGTSAPGCSRSHPVCSRARLC